MSPTILAHYRRNRERQQSTWQPHHPLDSEDRGHAAAALLDARRHVHFMKRMKQYAAPKKSRRI